MGWKTVVLGADCVVSLSYNRMKVTIGNEFQNIPLCDLNTVIFSHDKMTITIPLLAKLIENNINVVVCNSKNDPIGVFQAFNTHSLVFKHLNRQIEWKLTRKKRLWKIIVENKIQSEIDTLRLIGKMDDEIYLLKQYRDTVLSSDSTNREALSARIYFSKLFGKEFIREESIPLNFALNYGYKIIASYISRCIVSRGLLTQLGIHHIGESNPFNLTYDFIESFRAVVDLWVFRNIDDQFGVPQKIGIIRILEAKVFVQDKWFRLSDAIEDIVDSYIGYMNEVNKDVLAINYAKGIQFYEE